MRAIWTRRALADLHALSSHIAEHNPQAADRLRNRLVAAIALLEAYPLSGRAGRVAETRELIVAGTSFVIPYRVRDGQLQILAVLHGAREWPAGDDLDPE